MHIIFSSLTEHFSSIFRPRNLSLESEFKIQKPIDSRLEAGGKPSTMVTAGGNRRAYYSEHESNGQKTFTFHYFYHFLTYEMLYFQLLHEF